MSIDRPLMLHTDQKLASESRSQKIALWGYRSLIVLSGAAAIGLPAYMPEATYIQQVFSTALIEIAAGITTLASVNLMTTDSRALNQIDRERWLRQVLDQRALTPDEVSAIQSLPNRSTQFLAQGLARGGSAIRRLLPGRPV